VREQHGRGQIGVEDAAELFCAALRKGPAMISASVVDDEIEPSKVLPYSPRQLARRRAVTHVRRKGVRALRPQLGDEHAQRLGGTRDQRYLDSARDQISSHGSTDAGRSPRHEPYSSIPIHGVRDCSRRVIRT
jgi:hypothetical protein